MSTLRATFSQKFSLHTWSNEIPTLPLYKQTSARSPALIIQSLDVCKSENILACLTNSEDFSFANDFLMPMP